MAPRSRSLPSALLALAVVVLVAAPGCTIVKPIACAVAYPPLQVAERIDRADDREPDDLPGPVLLAAFPVLFPINYVYWTVHGSVSGLFSGVVNDLNVITGSGTIEKSWDTMLEPQRTNRTVEGD